MTEVPTASPVPREARSALRPGADAPRSPGVARLLPGWAAWMGIVGGLGVVLCAGWIAQKVLSQTQILYVSAGFAVLGGLSGLMGVAVGARLLRSWPAFGLVTTGGTSALCAAFLLPATTWGTIGNERVVHLLALMGAFGLLCAAGGGLAIVARSRAAVLSLVKGLAASGLLLAIGAGAFLLLRGGTPGWMTGGLKAVVIVAAVLGSVVLVGLVSYAGHALIRAFEMGMDAAGRHRDDRRG